MVGEGGIYRIGVYKFRDDHDKWSGAQSNSYSMRVYFRKGVKVNPIEYLFRVFKRIFPHGEVFKDYLEGFQFVGKTKGKASDTKAWLSVRGYVGGVVGIEPQRLPMDLTKKCLAAMAQEIKKDFPGAIIEGIRVA